MKKALLTVAVAALSLSAGATAADNFSGGYVGVQAGAGFGTKVKEQGTTADTLSGTTMVANLLGGYGSVFSESLYAGAELQAGTGFGENKKTANGRTLKLKNKNFFTVGGRFGYLPTPEVMLFASMAVGVEQARLSAQANGAQVSSSSSAFIVVPGVGAEFKVAQNVSLRADVLYKLSGSHKFNFASGVTARGKTRQPILKVGVTYHF